MANMFYSFCEGFAYLAYERFIFNNIVPNVLLFDLLSMASKKCITPRKIFSEVLTNKKMHSNSLPNIKSIVIIYFMSIYIFSRVSHIKL